MTTGSLTPGRLAAGIAILLVLAGCDVNTDVVLQPEIGGGASEQRVEAVESELAEQRLRADGLAADVEHLRAENVVLATDDGFTFRLNTNAAVVLIFAILGVVAVLVARMKFAADVRRGADPDDLGAA